MEYKRSEGFRYEFPNPIHANYKILINGRTVSFDPPVYNGQIHDISPRGMKLFSEVSFAGYSNKLLQLEIHFTLDEIAITAVANIVWEKPHAKGIMYGLIFVNQPKLEAIIIAELKGRRRKEVLLGNKR